VGADRGAPQPAADRSAQPTQAGKAIVVSLLNADAVVTGATAQFGEAMLLDLGGLGIRGMTWSPTHAAVLLVAGPQTDVAGVVVLDWRKPPAAAFVYGCLGGGGAALLAGLLALSLVYARARKVVGHVTRPRARGPRRGAGPAPRT